MKKLIFIALIGLSVLTSCITYPKHDNSIDVRVNRIENPWDTIVSGTWNCGDYVFEFKDSICKMKVNNALIQTLDYKVGHDDYIYLDLHRYKPHNKHMGMNYKILRRTNHVIVMQDEASDVIIVLTRKL